jgi:plastocyanin
MKRHHLLSAFAVLLVLAACSGDDADSTSTSTQSAPEATITMADFAFTGATTVGVGETVTVMNEDNVAHTWTAVDGDFDSGNLAEGESFEHAFDEAGEFDFFCSIHPTMTGSITVEG